jgi:hypothetical protein
MSVRIKGTVHEWEIDDNKKGMVNLPMAENEAGSAAIIAENDAGDVTGTRSTRAIEVSSDFRLRVGQDNMIFNESFPGAALNTSLWQAPTATMTVTVVNGFAVLNAGLSLALNAVSQVRTYRHFPCYKQYTTYAELEMQLLESPITGNKCEWGLFLAATTAAPTDGAFFRLDQAGTFNCVANYNGVEIQSAALDVALIGVGQTHAYLIYIGSNVVRFWIDNILVAEIENPSGQGSSMSSMNLPLAFRNHNTAATSVAQVMRIGNTNVTFGDQAMSKPWGHILSGAGGSSTQGQTGSILGSTALYNNAAPAAGAALSNTAAAAQFLGLGGIYNVAPTLIAGTDGILSSFQVPLGTAVLPGKTLYVTEVILESVVTTALVGGPVIYSASLAYGHTAVSLATAEGATTKAARRVPLGVKSYVSAAAQGATVPRITASFASAPIAVYPGEFVQIALRNLGVVTTSGVITFVASFNGYWE